MITIHVSAEVTDDRRVLVKLPPEVPLGRVDLIVTVATGRNGPTLPRSNLADWAAANAEEWGDRVISTDVESFTGRRL